MIFADRDAHIEKGDDMKIFPRLVYGVAVKEKVGTSPANHDKPETHIDVFEIIELDLDEVDPKDAPMATRWEPRAKIGPREKHTLWYNESHWTPLRTQNQVPIRTEDFIENAPTRGIEILVGKEEGRLIAALGNQQEGPLDPSDFEAIIHSNREKRLEALKQRISDLITVDGTVYRKVGQPFYHLSNWKPGEKGDLEFHILLERPGMDFNPFNSFGADNLNEMIKFHEICTGKKKGVQHPEVHAIEVLIPESISYDREINALCHIVWKTLECQTDGLIGWSNDSIDAWIDLRQTLQEVQTDGYDAVDEDGADELCEKLHFYSTVASSPHGAALAKAGAERWRNRTPRQDSESSLSPGIR